MDYLERNRRLIEEIRTVPLIRGNLLAQQDHLNGGATNFYSLGNYHSLTLDAPLHLGLKVYANMDRIMPTMRFALDLSTLRTISTNFPHLTSELPTVYAYLCDLTENPLGFVMEDFSEGGAQPVHNLHEWDTEVLPKEIRTLNPTIQDEELAKIGFMVNGKRRLGDFNTMRPLDMRLITTNFPIQDILETIDDYTIRTTL